jgi:hypothetical protein
MKGIIEFDLDDADDKLAFNRCSKSLALASVIWEFKHNVRRQIENRIDNIHDKDEIVDIVFTTFNDLLFDNNIDLDDLIE